MRIPKKPSPVGTTPPPAASLGAAAAAAPAATGIAAVKLDVSRFAAASKALGLQSTPQTKSPLESQAWAALGPAAPRFARGSGEVQAFADYAIAATIKARTESEGRRAAKKGEAGPPPVYALFDLAARSGLTHVRIADGSDPSLAGKPAAEVERRQALSRALLAELSQALFASIPHDVLVRELPDLVRALVVPSTPEAAAKLEAQLARATAAKALHARADVTRTARRYGFELPPGDVMRLQQGLRLADEDPKKAAALIEDILAAAESFVKLAESQPPKLSKADLQDLRAAAKAPAAPTLEQKLAQADQRVAALQAEVAHAKTPTELERFKGALVGLAIGDALGGPTEFMSREQIRAKHGIVTDMIGGGWLHLKPGEYTDDTQMAERMAGAILAKGKFDAGAVADAFVDWLNTDPKDVGGLTRQALELRRSGVAAEDAGLIPWVLSGFENSGNGSVMRAAPAGLLTAFRDVAEIDAVARASSAVTHADPRATYGTTAINLATALLMRGEADVTDKVAAFVADKSPELAEAILAAKTLTLDEVRTSGYSVHTVQAAFWALEHAKTYVDGIVNITNLGEDTDTAGATAGILLGAKFGLEGIPPSWRQVLDKREHLEGIAAGLHALARKEA
jgi:ADP-ribosyl-[dinitrogen reductase] hydrolase